MEDLKETAKLCLKKKIVGDSEHKKIVYNLLQSKGVDEELIAEICTCGLTDEAIEQLECLGLTYEDVVAVDTALKEAKAGVEVCDCTFDSASSGGARSYRESEYLRASFEEVLPLALRELALRKPYKPLEYLGHWLLHYRECEEREKRRKEWEAELLEERLKLIKPEASEPSDHGEEEEEEEEEACQKYAESTEW